MRARPVHPFLELRLGGGGAGGVVGEAEVHDVGREVARGGHEAVRGVAVKIDEPRVAPACVRARAAGHHVRVHVHGIDGIGHRDDDVLPEELLDVAAVALRAVRDEDLVGRHVHAVGLEVVLRDGLAEEVITLLGTVAAERLARGLVVHGAVHRGDHGGREGLGDVADAEADHLRLRVRVLVGLDAVGDFGEQVRSLYLQVVFIDANHLCGLLSLVAARSIANFPCA